jgi:bacterioferritin
MLSLGAMSTPFNVDIRAIRNRAREHTQDGAVTPSYGMEVGDVVGVLNTVLATEIVCRLRYLSHYHLATGFRGRQAAEEFLEHANEEQTHADMVAERITELGGVPNFDPNGLFERSHAEYRVSRTLPEMLKEDLVAERVAIEVYGEIIRWIGDRDPTTRRIMEEILAKEEEHANDLAELLAEK